MARPAVFHAAAKDATLCPGVDIRGPVVHPRADRRSGQGQTYGLWCNAWPENPAWKFVAVGLGNDVPFWTEFLRTLAEIDPGMAVKHEDAACSQTEGLSPWPPRPAQRRGGPLNAR
ncbi:hypothetical protein ACH4TV_46455 [Streptomyces sp. NPDC020898]|uniref:hypothetical protein n=1 Tax=Streptomyces sp. NPDC020898 TaxID=3365101 RepID=UPI0037AC883A